MSKSSQKTTSAAKAACRIYGFLARSAPVGVLLRRGPTRWVRLIRWDVTEDRFQYGHWFHGRIYEDKCDISPDGKLFAYFASKPHLVLNNEVKNDGYGHVWTAISKPPWLTALVLWPNYSYGTYYGGGLFISSNEVYVHGGNSNHHPDHAPVGITVTKDAMRCFGQWPGWNLWQVRSLRDGWRIPEGKFTVAEKNDHSGEFVLSRKLQEYHKNPFGGIAEYNLELKADYTVSFRNQQLKAIENATWADWDQRNRLIYAQNGKIYAQQIFRDELKSPTVIADFNDMTPESISPPEWACHW